MHSKIFETHAHYEDAKFDADREALIASLPEHDIEYVINVGSSLETTEKSIALAEQYDFIYAAVGVHPSDVIELNEKNFKAIEQAAEHKKAVAVGEIGLDYYWEDNPPRAFQQTVFRKQLALAAELDLPVIVHDREAHGDCLAIIKEFPTVTGVFHCFSGSPEMAAELLKRGWYLGFDGPITYKNAKRAPEVAAVTPLERIVVETDAPYMAPVPMRGKRNDSRYLPYVIEKLAEWKGVTAEEMTRVTWENGRRLFRI